MKKILALLFLILLTSCSFKKVSVYPTLGEEVKDEAKKQEYIDKIKNNQKLFQNARILNDVIFVQDGEGYKFRYLFVFDSDGNLRMEAFPPETFLTIHLLVQNKDEAIFLDRQQKLALKAKNANQILKEMLGQKMNCKIFIDGFLGNSSLKEAKDYNFYIITKNIEEAKGVKILQLVDKKTNEYYEYFLNDLSLFGYEYWQDNETLLVKIRRDDEFFLLILPESDIVMNFRATNKEFDTDIKDSVYKIKRIPKDYKIKEM